MTLRPLPSSFLFMMARKWGTPSPNIYNNFCKNTHFFSIINVFLVFSQMKAYFACVKGVFGVKCEYYHDLIRTCFLLIRT